MVAFICVCVTIGVHVQPALKFGKKAYAGMYILVMAAPHIIIRAFVRAKLFILLVSCLKMIAATVFISQH